VFESETGQADGNSLTLEGNISDRHNRKEVNGPDEVLRRSMMAEAAKIRQAEDGGRRTDHESASLRQRMQTRAREVGQPRSGDESVRIPGAMPETLVS
jgi:hypothetical protein